MTAPPDLDLDGLRHRRLGHLRDHLGSAGIELAVLTNPVSIRYATGYRGYATFQSRIPSQYLLVPVEGPVVLHGAYTDDLSTVDRCDVAHSVTGFDAGLDFELAAKRFAGDIAVAASDAGLDVSTATIGVERSTPTGHRALELAGLHIADIEPTVELARSRKLVEEMPALRYAIAVAELGMAHMHAALEPGMTENRLFAILHQTNIAHDGDWIDGRMLCSGPRTNPWYQEASARVIEAGDLVAFDTDMVGPFGYCADISRTWTSSGNPTVEQRDLHARALEEIAHNTELLRPGASFLELSQAAFRHPERFVKNRYACVYHGVGMSDEYPKIPYRQDWHWTGYDGELEAGTVLSVESYVGAERGREGVKLEQMVQVNEDGVVPLSTFPTGLQPELPPIHDPTTGVTT
ncbi:MAG: Xaa-Pro peptidase family protein [Actinomycetota bacterium]